MAQYTTTQQQHILPSWMAPYYHLDTPPHHDYVRTTTVVPPLRRASTTASWTPPIEDSHSTLDSTNATPRRRFSQSLASQGGFDLGTLAHFLHAFHAHYNRDNNQAGTSPRDEIPSRAAAAASDELEAYKLSSTTLPATTKAKTTTTTTTTATAAGTTITTAPKLEPQPSQKHRQLEPPQLPDQQQPATTTTRNNTQPTSTPLFDLPSGIVAPAFDLAETPTQYIIHGELPGLARADVTVETDDDQFAVTVSGALKRSLPPPSLPPSREDMEKEKETETRGGVEGVHWHVEERQVGRFRRQFRFPEGTVDMAGVEASMREGLLCVVVPKVVATASGGE